MGNAAIYFYPCEDGGFHKIDLGCHFSDVHEVQERMTQTSHAGDLQMTRVDYGGRMRVRFILEHSGDRGVAAELRTLQAHLAKGLPVSVVADTDYAWASCAQTWSVRAGKNSIATLGNLFNGYALVTSVSAGDYVCLSSANPVRYVEEHYVNSWTAADQKITFAAGDTTLYDHLDGPCFIRHQFFWPIMYLPDELVSVPIVTSNRWQTWSLDMTLVDKPIDYKAFWTDDASDVGTSQDLWGENDGVLGGDVVYEEANEIAGWGSGTLQGLIKNSRMASADTEESSEVEARYWTSYW